MNTLTTQTPPFASVLLVSLIVSMMVFSIKTPPFASVLLVSLIVSMMVFSIATLMISRQCSVLDTGVGA